MTVVILWCVLPVNVNVHLNMDSCGARFIYCSNCAAWPCINDCAPPMISVVKFPEVESLVCFKGPQVPVRKIVPVSMTTGSISKYLIFLHTPQHLIFFSSL